MSLAATLTMVLMLLLLAGFFILQNVLLASLSFVEQKVEVVAYVENTATQDQVDELVARIDAMPETASVEFITRDVALERFRAAQEAQGREDLTKYLESNPLYASLNVKLTSPGDLEVVAEALRQDPIVRNVLNIEALVERVTTVTGVVRTGGGVAPRRRGPDRPVHHREHDPARRGRTRRGDRDHAPGGRVGRVHPLAVRVRGGARGPAGRAHHAGAAGHRRGPAVAGDGRASSTSCRCSWARWAATRP